MARWSEDEKIQLREAINGKQNYSMLGSQLSRSTWAVECQVIKYCRENSIDPLEYSISEESLQKYDSKNKVSAQKAQLEIEEKRLHIRALTSLLDLSEIKSLLVNINERLTRLEEEKTY